jgi:hypothetical protein
VDPDFFAIANLPSLGTYLCRLHFSGGQPEEKKEKHSFVMLRAKKLTCNGRKSPLIFNSLPAIKMNLLSSLAKICANKTGTSPYLDEMPVSIEQL